MQGALMSQERTVLCRTECSCLSKNVVFYPINARRAGFERINFDFLQKKFEKGGAGGKMLRKMGVQPLKG